MILKLIASENIETQEELARLLALHGFEVTQATVSRDIKELRLIKVQTGEGRYKYATVERAESDMQDRFINLFSNCVISITSAGNIIVIKTLSGCANAAAEAIDTSNFPEIVGTIAGDNTIFMVISTKEAVPPLMEQFHEMTAK